MPMIDIPNDPPLGAWPRSGPVAILDLEYTAWEGSAARGWSGPDEWREIVDIGCVVVDGKDFAEREAFSALVRPQRNPLLSDYFKDLTGIQQADVDAKGRSFADALAALSRFLGDHGPIIFNGYDGKVVRENCEMHGLALPWKVERMHDFRPLLSTALGEPSSRLTSSGLPALAGIELNGQAHTALYDARAIAGSFAAWRRAGRL